MGMGLLAIAIFRECWDQSTGVPIAISASWSALHRLCFEPGARSCEVNPKSGHAFGQISAE